MASASDTAPSPMHPLNGALRLGLELCALGAMGWWGLYTGDGVLSYALMVGVPLAAAVIWGVFAVPGDPSRGGQGLVPVSGWIRLAIEAAVFGFGVWALHDLNQKGWAIALGSATALHYAISWDRIRWLIRQ